MINSVYVFFVCLIGMERTIQCSTLGVWKQHLMKPSMEKPEM